MADDQSSSSSDDDIVHCQPLGSDDDDDDDEDEDEDDDSDHCELGNLAEGPAVSVKKTTRQSFFRNGTGSGLDQRVQEMIESRDNSQLVASSGGQEPKDILALATGGAIQCGTNTTLVQLNVTQQQFGDVTVEKATHVNQMFGGSQNISKTATIYEGQRRKELISRADNIMERTVSHFQAWNQSMVKTAALGQVLDKLNSGTSWLTIKGNPGEGKTTVGYMALEELHKCGRQVFEVRSPDEFTEVISTCPRPVIMLDDVFGSLEFDQSKWSNWEPVVSPLLKEREHKSHEGEDQTSKKDATVILIGRDYALNSASVDLGRLSLFLKSDKHVVCIDHSLKRDFEEKRALWESISRSSDVELDTVTVEEIIKIQVPHGFPHVCRLFTTIYKENKAISAVDFFRKPLDFLNKSISYLFKDTNKVMLFREMVKHDGKMSKKHLRIVDGTYRLIQVAQELVGSYIRFDDDNFVFDHPSIYDSVAFHMCSLDAEFVIQQCHLSFIHERIRLQDTESSSAAESGLVVYVERSHEDDLAERFAAEIIERNFFPVLSHQAFRYGTFVRKVMSKIEPSLKSLLTERNNLFKYDDTFLCFLPSSKSPELLKYIDNCPEIELTEDDEEDILFGTCKYAASEVLAYLKDTRESLQVNVIFNHWRYSLTPLMIAAETKDIQFVNHILSFKPDLNAKNKMGMTALHYLCQNGLGSAVSQVIDSGVDIGVVDVGGESPLCYACEYNQLEVVKLLIERGVRVDQTSLVNACRGGNLHIVEMLFEKETNLNTQVVFTKSLSAASEGGNTDIMNLLVDKGASVNSCDSMMPPLNVSCWNDQNQAAQWLLQHGADINSRDSGGDTALHKAAGRGSEKCTEMLLTTGAAVNIQNKLCDTALHRAAGSKSKECVDLLLKAGASVNIQNKHGDTALLRAAERKSDKCVKVFLKAGATVNVQNKHGNTALHRAAETGSEVCCDMLLKAGAEVNIQNKHGDAALHRAAWRGCEACVGVLLKAGAAVNTRNKQGDTALHIAAENRSLDCDEVMLKANGRVNTQNKQCFKAIHGATESGSKDCVERLLKAGARVNVQNKDGDTPLHRAAGSGSKECVDVLLKADTNCHIQNIRGDTALHRAAWRKSKECVVLLLKAGASVNMQDKEGDTPLHEAVWLRSKECVEVLLKAGAKVNIQNNEGDTGLHIAAWGESIECCEVLLKVGAKVNTQNDEGDTALHEAAWRGKKENVDLLLKAGAKVNIRNNEGYTALHEAAERGTEACVELLLTTRVKVNEQTKDGDTALHRAASSGSKECVEMLLKAGAKVNVQNKEGYTALDKAKGSQSKDCVEMLGNAGAEVRL